MNAKYLVTVKEMVSEEGKEAERCLLQGAGVTDVRASSVVNIIVRITLMCELQQ